VKHAIATHAPLKAPLLQHQAVAEARPQSPPAIEGRPTQVCARRLARPLLSGDSGSLDAGCSRPAKTARRDPVPWRPGSVGTSTRRAGRGWRSDPRTRRG
jgi:hypothetical protein